MTEPRDTAAAAPSERRVHRSLLALLPPLVALGLQLALWPVVQPSAWFLFYPAVFVSSWIGGLRSAVIASVVCAAGALWFFLPPSHSFIAAPGQYLAASVFITTSVLFGVFHDRLRAANRRIAGALSATELANADLNKALTERQIFAALVANSSDFIGIADPDGKPVYLNPAGRRMVGLAADQPVESTSIPEYYPPEQRAFASDVIIKGMVENGHWQGETFFRHWQTQEAIPVSDTHFMIREPATARVLGMGTVTRDISDIKHARDEADRARRKLQEANDAIASLVELAPEGIFTADRDGRYTDVNTAGCLMLGLERQEIIGKTILDLIPGDRVEQFEREKQQLFRGQEVVSEWVLCRKDGSWLPVEVNAKILPDGRWQGFVRDISERKRLEAALQVSHDDLVRAQSVAEVGSWRLDVRHNVLQWSDEQYRIFGIAPGTPMTYEAFLACVHPEDRAYVERAWTAALREQPYDIEHRIVVNGKVRWVREKADLEFDENRALVGGIGITLHITERKEREEELRQVQERLDLALQGAELALWDWDVATGEVVFNPRWAEMRGHRPEDIPGRVDQWIASIHPDDWPRVEQAVADYFEGRRPEYEAEYRVGTRSGEWIWVLDRGKVFARNAKGEPIRMLGTELDITSRKSAEQALHRSEAKAAGIVSISADAIISIDDQQRITLFNDGAQKIFGYTKEEALGASLELLIPARLRANHRQHVERFAAGESTAQRMGERGAAIFGLRKNGEEFPADAAISQLAVNGTKILTVALRDVTEQKRFEDAQRILSETGSLLASSLELEATLTSVGQIATRTFADVCVVYLIERGKVRRVTATSRDRSLDWVCEALTQMPLDRSRAHEVWSELDANRAVLMEHGSTEMLAAFARSDQHLRALRALAPGSIIMAPLFVHEELLGAMAFVSTAPTFVYSPADVRLAGQVAERAAYAINSARLYATTQRAVEARDTVLRVVAHDLRNPLSTILMQSTMLRRHGAQPERRSMRPADAIERSARRMNRIIQDLLDVTRIEQGQLSIEPSRISPGHAITESVEAQVLLATAASLELQLEVERDLPEIWADHDRLLQIFENLIGNAVKFTGAGGIIRVGAARRDREVLFWVADTGIGISAEALPHLFDRYWQARKTDRRGLGLGLAIVKGLVEAHGGRIWIESTLDQGATFFFTVPMASQAEQWAPGSAPRGP